MPRHVRIVLPAVHTKSPLPQQIRSVCVACGCRNLVTFGARSQHVQCRVCGVVSPDFYRRKPPNGYASEHGDLLDKNQANGAGSMHAGNSIVSEPHSCWCTVALLDEMLDALTHDNTKRKLQTLLQKQGASPRLFSGEAFRESCCRCVFRSAWRRPAPLSRTPHHLSSFFLCRSRRRSSFMFRT
jgi:hypothetical protein